MWPSQNIYELYMATVAGFVKLCPEILVGKASNIYLARRIQDFQDFFQLYWSSFFFSHVRLFFIGQQQYDFLTFPACF